MSNKCCSCCSTGVEQCIMQCWMLIERCCRRIEKLYSIHLNTTFVEHQMLNHVSLPLWDHQLHNYISDLGQGLNQSARIFFTRDIWGRRSFIDPICRNSCMVLSMFYRLVLANFLLSLRDINLTLGLLPP